MDVILKVMVNQGRGLSKECRILEKAPGHLAVRQIAGGPTGAGRVVRRHGEIQARNKGCRT